MVRRPGEVWLSVYEVSRCFGGREEGGWWFDWYTYTGKSVARRKHAAHEHGARMADTLEQPPGRTHRTMVVMVESTRGEFQTHSRPRYE